MRQADCGRDLLLIPPQDEVLWSGQEWLGGAGPSGDVQEETGTRLGAARRREVVRRAHITQSSSNYVISIGKRSTAWSRVSCANTYTCLRASGECETIVQDTWNKN